MTGEQLEVLPGGLRELGRRLNWSERKTYIAAKRGDLPFVVKIGGVYIVPVKAYERWLSAPNSFTKQDQS